jgi:hypothetical protein
MEGQLKKALESEDRAGSEEGEGDEKKEGKAAEGKDETSEKKSGKTSKGWS